MMANCNLEICNNKSSCFYRTYPEIENNCLQIPNSSKDINYRLHVTGL